MISGEDSSDTAIQLESIPAAYGDCLLVTVPTPSGDYRMLVDVGPDIATLNRLRTRLCEIPLGPDGRRHIDLFVVSHIDHDHIGNAVRLLRDETLALTFGDVWFNGRQHVLEVERGAREGYALGDLLHELALPWNVAFGGGPVVVPTGSEFLACQIPAPAPTLTLLSPSVASLSALAKVWPLTVQMLTDEESEPDDDGLVRGRPAVRPPIDMPALAVVKFYQDRSRPNGSSIVILVEHRGASLLLAADGHPLEFSTAMLKLLESRGSSASYVDAIKLSHHGSRANTNASLAVLGAEHYVVSTDNTRFGHPDDEAIARLIVNGVVPPTFWFNADTPMNRRWADPGLQLTGPRFEVRYPDDPARGAVLALPARE